MAVTVRHAAWLVAAAMVAVVGPGVSTAAADDTDSTGLSTDSSGTTDPGTSTSTPIGAIITPIAIVNTGALSGDPGSSADPGAVTDTGGTSDGLTDVVVSPLVAYSSASGTPLLLGSTGPISAPTSTPGQRGATSAPARVSRRVTVAGTASGPTAAGRSKHGHHTN